jgi:GT2 family glycosyltransferase
MKDYTFSILIVTYNRRAELEQTLNVIQHLLEEELEVLVWDDASTDETLELAEKFSFVKWFSGKERVGGSKARSQLYVKARGKYLIGLDDDANPLDDNILEKVKLIFENEPATGLLAFRLYWGLKTLTTEEKYKNPGKSFTAADFAACGFAIRREAFIFCGGFPKWMNIYGEETYLALRIYQNGYSIRYSPEILVQHRVDIKQRRQKERMQFWYYNQLLNMSRLYLLMFPLKVGLNAFFRLYKHNFLKYGITSWSLFRLSLKAMFKSLFDFPRLSRTEARMDSELLTYWKSLPPAIYYWKTDGNK